MECLCISFPPKEKSPFRSLIIDSFQKKGIEPIFGEVEDLTFDGTDFRYQQQSLTTFDRVFIGMTNSWVKVRPVFLDWLTQNNVQFLVYGDKNEHQSKPYELYKLSSQDISVIPSLVTLDIEEVKNFAQIHGYPLITKPIDGRKGQDVKKHADIESVQRELTSAQKFRIVQPFIPNEGDHRIIIVQGTIVGAIHRKPSQSDEFRSNVSVGGTASQIVISPEEEHLALTAYATMNLDIAGIDIIQNSTTGQLFVMETNSAPQMIGFYQSTHINIADTIADYLLTR